MTTWAAVVKADSGFIIFNIETRDHSSTRVMLFLYLYRHYAVSAKDVCGDIQDLTAELDYDGKFTDSSGQTIYVDVYPVSDTLI